MNAVDLKNYFEKISAAIAAQEAYLIELDQQNGDGDLGLSMRSGFASVCAAVRESENEDLGKLFMQAATVFNENAPSSLGTILSFGMMGMAKALKGMTSADACQIGDAMNAGLEVIMSRAGSKLGEKTILDSIGPAIEELRSGGPDALSRAAAAAAAGSEATKGMVACHGRAAYYADKSIGVLDGGSVVGRIIFEAIAM